MTWRPRYPEYNLADGKTYDENTLIEEIPLFNPPEEWYHRLSSNPKTWPPKHVHLCDKVVGQVLRKKLPDRALVDYWTLDFVEEGIAPERLPAGPGYIITTKGIDFWALCFGEIVLLGDDGVAEYGVEARFLKHSQNAGAHVHIRMDGRADTLLPSGCRVPDATWTHSPVHHQLGIKDEHDSSVSLPVRTGPGRSECQNTDQEPQNESRLSIDLTEPTSSSNKRKRPESRSLGHRDHPKSQRPLGMLEEGGRSPMRYDRSRKEPVEVQERLDHDMGMSLGRERVENKHLHTMMHEIGLKQRDFLLANCPVVVQNPEYAKLEAQKARVHDAILSRSGSTQRFQGPGDVQRGLADVSSELKRRDWNEWKRKVADGEDE
jgi:hypothetical protein